MNEEQATSGTTVNPATNAHAPRQNPPVMDVTPPPASTPSEPTVVAAPPDMADIPPISDDIAEQIAADSAIAPVSSEPVSQQPTSEPEMATPPVEEDSEPTNTSAPASTDSPDELIQSETHRDNLTAPPVEVRTDREGNPALVAVVIALFMMVILAALAVFAYMSSQN